MILAQCRSFLLSFIEDATILYHFNRNLLDKQEAKII